MHGIIGTMHNARVNTSTDSAAGSSANVTVEPNWWYGSSDITVKPNLWYDSEKPMPQCSKETINKKLLLLEDV